MFGNQVGKHQNLAQSQETHAITQRSPSETSKNSGDLPPSTSVRSANENCSASEAKSVVPPRLAVSKDSGSNSTRLFQAKPWQTEHGASLRSFSIVQDSGSLVDDPRWNNKPIPQHGERTTPTVTVNSNRKPVAFTLTDLDSARIKQLGHATNKSLQELLARNQVAPFIDKAISTPMIVGASTFNYKDNIESGGQKYSDYRLAQANRIPMVYITSSLGSLHGYNAADGLESFAYISGAAFTSGSAESSARPKYITGLQQYGDVFYNGKWHTILVAGLGNVGNGVYALDISSPPKPVSVQAQAADIALWEVSDTDDTDIGHVAGPPQIVRLHNERWAVVFGNGYPGTTTSSESAKPRVAVLFFVDIETGAIIKKLTVPSLLAGSPNGLSIPALIDTDNDHTVDYGYAGDLQGNLWKFDLKSNNPDNWAVAFGSESNPLPLFIAHDGAARPQNHQPIVQRPLVIRGPSGKGTLVLFSAGSEAVHTQVPSAAKNQTFYGVYDKGTDTEGDRILGRSHLQQQRIEIEFPSQGVGGNIGNYEYGLRAMSANPVDWNTKKGWYLDLPTATANLEMESFAPDPIVRGNKLILTTYTPTSAGCKNSASWILALNAETGGQLVEPVFDLNRDNLFDLKDLAWPNNATQVPVSGLQLRGAGAISTPVIVAGTRKEHLIAQSAEGTIFTLLVNLGTGGNGRQSWIQVQ